MSDRPINLLLIDNDAIFRLGLSNVLGNYSDFRVVVQTDFSKPIRETLVEHSIDLIILDPDTPNNVSEGWRFLQEIKQTYRTLKICLLSHLTDPLSLQTAKQAGVEGYCPKGITIERLIEQLQKIAQGQTVWPTLAVFSSNVTLEQPKSPQTWLLQGKQLGLKQINKTIKQINKTIKQINLQLTQNQLSWINKEFLKGKRRELLATKWLVNRFIPIDVTTAVPISQLKLSSTGSQNQNDPPVFSADSSTNILGVKSLNSLAIFKNTLKKLALNYDNLTSISLEIDILRTDKKEELMTIVIHQLGRSLEDLKFITVDASELPKNTAMIAQKIWHESAVNFLGKYCVLRSTITLDDIQNIIDHNISLVQKEFLRKIYYFDELLKYLLFDQKVIIEGLLYSTKSTEVCHRAEILLENFMIQTANGIVFLILNNFSDIEVISRKLFLDKMGSSREIAKFRNNLSWVYRQEQFWEEPRNIFESKYRLLFWSKKGIEATFIYASRQHELKQLKGIRWAVTIILESRDAFAPVLRSMVRLIGHGLVYLLTQVVGRGLGLIVRGIIQGISNSLQETRYGKNRERRDS
ncbi:DUF3685 domain-containing protein [cyanobacterium endosymbiont of Epithemia turgida]|uniref:DUF3685 domain-containing protein n=1 Tax=cyanobacterium endosymbiont of Epithemia turgida TaxID=718217 RepID=UPI0004D116DC|nr:DUF3685 domain-containing protein [cyanobacterium endosymbiont of Epithemia turgida]BAP17853.1 two-component response regulator receiver protein [cyanobacterium endosymbiont of Epithemia turgida isolate EtSB Lake Yunoko]